VINATVSLYHPAHMRAFADFLRVCADSEGDPTGYILGGQLGAHAFQNTANTAGLPSGAQAAPDKVKVPKQKPAAAPEAGLSQVEGRTRLLAAINDDDAKNKRVKALLAETGKKSITEMDGPQLLAFVTTVEKEFA
jgi:hypothetical protein